MFDIGFWEVVILFGIGLIVLGPERLPRVAAQLGRWAGRARVMARELSNQIRDEIEPIETGLRSAEETLRKDFSAKRPEPPAYEPPEDIDSNDTGHADQADAARETTGKDNPVT